MIEMMRVARDLGTPADWLVRAKHDRCLADDEGTKLWAATTNGTPLGKISFTMGGREKQKARVWKGLDQVHASAETLRALRDGLG